MIADREKRILIAQLVTARDTLASTIAQIDTSLLVLGVDMTDLENPLAELQGDCPHPPDQVDNLHKTLDDAPDDWFCGRCGRHQPEPFHPSEG